MYTYFYNFTQYVNNFVVSCTVMLLMFNFEFYCTYYCFSGFGCIGVACWSLVPKFARSNPKPSDF